MASPPARRPPIKQIELSEARVWFGKIVPPERELAAFVGLLNQVLEFSVIQNHPDRATDTKLPPLSDIRKSFVSLRADLARWNVISDDHWEIYGVSPEAVGRLRAAITELGEDFLKPDKPKRGRPKEAWRNAAPHYAVEIAKLLKGVTGRDYSTTKDAGPVARIGALAVKRTFLIEKLEPATFADAVQSALSESKERLC